MSGRRNNKNSNERAGDHFDLQDEEARSLFLTAAESERRAWIEGKYPGFMSFMNRKHSNRGGSNDDYPSDELNDARSDAGLPEIYNDEELCVTVDELAKLLHDAELTTQRPTSAMSNTYVNSVPRRPNNVRFQSPPLDNARRSCSLNEIYDRPRNDLVTSSRGALNRVASLSPRVLPRHATNPFIADCQSPATLQSSRPTATITEIVPSSSNSRMSCNGNTQSDRIDAMSRTSTSAYRARDLESRRSITSRRNDSRDPEPNRLRDSYPPVQRNVSLNNPFAYTHYMPNSISLFNDIVKQIPKFDGTPYKLDLFSVAVEEAVEQLPLYERRILRALESKLVGKAERIASRLTNYRRASELLRDLRDKFVNKQVADKLALDLGNVAQPVDVDAREFGSDVRSLYEDAIAAYSQAPDINAIERDAAIYSLQNSVMDCFLLGLREPLQLQVRLKNPQCLADAIDIAGDIENRLRYRAVAGSNVTSVGLIGVRTQLGTTKDSESERATDDKRTKCQLCKKTGHEAADCSKYKRATLKCSNCGWKGHEASTCRRPSKNDRDSRRYNRDDRDNRDSRRDNRDSRRDSRDSRRDSRDDRDDRDSRRDYRSPRRDSRDSRDTSVDSNSRRNYYNRNNDMRRDNDRDRYARSASPDYRNSNNYNNRNSQRSQGYRNNKSYRENVRSDSRQSNDNREPARDNRNVHFNDSRAPRAAETQDARDKNLN
ncbi:unnamed protein product [Trichogramma brassicae]|uniref:CCHC-type domain-containing protein n=1 Tax=Trichogramma brassicae TaxID=86971 RepID=A0A6H5J9U9_9HYME|nr:unnamed protein product [Trichogramma brassicae]